MQSLIVLLYGVFLIVYVLVALFIVFHLKRYMIHQDAATTIIAVFIAITAVLFVINSILFTLVPFDKMFSFS